jgi:Domain of unknown function (DUF4211)
MILTSFPSEPVSSPLSNPPSSPIAPQTDEEGYSSPLPASKRRKSGRLNEQSTIEHATPSRKSTRLQNRPTIRHRESTSSSQFLVAVESPSPGRQPFDLGSPETSGDAEDVIVTRPATRRRRSKPVKDDDFVVDDDRVEYITSDEEPVRSSTKRRRWTKDDFVADDDRVEYISSDGEPVRSSAKRRGWIKDDFVVDNDEVEFITSDDEPTARPKTRRISHSHRSPRTPRRRSRKEQEELNEDLEDLQDSDSAIKPSRTRGGPVNTQRDIAREHLKILRRRRAGEKIPRVEDSDEGEPNPVELDFIGREMNAYPPSDNTSVHSLIDTEPEASDNGEDVEDDFIENDSPGSQRLPHPDIPLEFTSYASSKPKELFPHIIEWLVKNKIAPAFSRDDQLWQLAFDKVNDQVHAQAGSRLISAAWNATFKHSLLARPGIRVETLPGFEEFRTCDACNKTNHPALYDFIFSGQAYDKGTLEVMEKDSDVENEDDDNSSRDEQGRPLAPATQHFYLGRFCAANAEMGHKLTHWKFHLNENMLSYLEEQGVLSAEAILAREKMSNKKREKEAERIVDQMQETGMISKLWRDFQNDLEDARLGMEGYEKKGGRSRGRIGAVRSGRGEDMVVREWREEKDGRQVRALIRVDSDSE